MGNNLKLTSNEQGSNSKIWLILGIIIILIISFSVWYFIINNGEDDDGALLYQLPIDLENSKILGVSENVKLAQAEDTLSRDKSLTESQRKEHELNALNHLILAEGFAEDQEKLLLQYEIGQRYRDSNNCEESIKFFKLVANNTDQVALRSRALLEINNCEKEINDNKEVEVTIEDFINSFNLEEMQEIQIFLEIPEKEIQIFGLNYGAPQDCPAGCFYNRVGGIKYGEKIGWIIGTGDIGVYNLSSYDKYLFSEEFLNKFKSESFAEQELTGKYGIFQQSYNEFIYLLAKDIDTPRSTLLKIATGNYSYFNTLHPIVANLLLDNPTVKLDNEILTIISNIKGEDYRVPEIRNRANNLLNELS